MPQESILLERKGKIAIVTIDRPQRLNAFNENMFFALEQAAGQLKDNLPRAVIITGTGGKAFSAGFDVNPDNPLVVRLYEVNGRPADVSLSFDRSIDRVLETDMREHVRRPPLPLSIINGRGSVSLQLAPFEVRTLKVRVVGTDA